MSSPQRCLVFFISLSLSVIFFSPCVKAEGRSSQFTELFNTAAFLESAKHKDSNYIKKWTQDVVISVAGDVTNVDAFKRTFDLIALQVNRFINEVPINVAFQKEAPNFNVFLYESFSDLSQLLSGIGSKIPRYHSFTSDVLFRVQRGKFNSEGPPCFSAIIEHEGEINHALMILPAVTTKRELSRCMAPELLTAMGLLGKFYESVDSTLTRTGQLTEFSALDIQLIRVLYSDSVRPGMSVNETGALLDGLMK